MHRSMFHRKWDIARGIFSILLHVVFLGIMGGLAVLMVAPGAGFMFNFPVNQFVVFWIGAGVGAVLGLVRGLKFFVSEVL